MCTAGENTSPVFGGGRLLLPKGPAKVKCLAVQHSPLRSLYLSLFLALSLSLSIFPLCVSAVTQGHAAQAPNHIATCRGADGRLLLKKIVIFFFASLVFLACTADKAILYFCWEPYTQLVNLSVSQKVENMKKRGRAVAAKQQKKRGVERFSKHNSAAFQLIALTAETTEESLRSLARSLALVIV